MTKKLDIIRPVKSLSNWKNFFKKIQLFICSSIRINLKVRGTGKNSSIRANKSKINELRKKIN